jgi:hypothetical protein
MHVMRSGKGGPPCTTPICEPSWLTCHVAAVGWPRSTPAIIPGPAPRRPSTSSPSVMDSASAVQSDVERKEGVSFSPRAFALDAFLGRDDLAEPFCESVRLRYRVASARLSSPTLPDSGPPPTRLAVCEANRPARCPSEPSARLQRADRGGRRTRDARAVVRISVFGACYGDQSCGRAPPRATGHATAGR